MRRLPLIVLLGLVSCSRPPVPAPLIMPDFLLPTFVEFTPQPVPAQAITIDSRYTLTLRPDRFTAAAWDLELFKLKGAGRGVELHNPMPAALLVTAEQSERGVMLHGVIFVDSITTLILSANDQHLHVTPRGNLFALEVPEWIRIDHATLIDADGRIMTIATQIQ